ncbi:MAG: hypothetical protein ABEJ98_03860 [Candidatus Nanohaloarchaea archaeon]
MKYEEPDAWSKIYRGYKYRIFPYVGTWLRGTTRLKLYLERKAQERIEKVSEKDVVPITELEWDNLIVIDACRYDVFCRVLEESEEVDNRLRNPDSRYSVASCTRDFITKTFSEGDWSDVVYISANPHLDHRMFKELTGRDVEKTFHTVYDTYRTDWSSEHETTLPEPVIRDALNAEKLFPKKRKIIHLMQPHQPFISYEYDVPIGGISHYIDGIDDPGEWIHAETGKLPHDEIVEGYIENTELVLDSLVELIGSLEGRTIITSDHGNLVGENGLYGHPCGSKTVALRKVPLVEIRD